MTFMSVGYLAQAFDLINVRDLNLIAQAREHCAELVVGVYTDELAEELYGRRPVVPLNERITLVSHVRGVDRVVVHGRHGVDLDEETIVFAVDGELGITAETMVSLEPQRHTESGILRAALEPADRGEAVA